MTQRAVAVSSRGSARWTAGHPWIYRSDVDDVPIAPGIVRVTDRRGRFLGQALWSPRSEIRLRLLTREADPVGAEWWIGRLRTAAGRRSHLDPPATAWRVVHAEADGLPSLIVDRYGDYVTVQLLSAGLESARRDVLDAVETVLAPRGVVLRNDVPVRRREGLPSTVETFGEPPPERLRVEEGGIGYYAALRAGQKTGAFLDQRENRALVGRLSRGRALDVFTYHGLFALHMARRADDVLGIDASGEALRMAEANRALNDAGNVRWRHGDAFDVLHELLEEGARFETIVLDPPAFAKDRRAVPTALRGYKAINLSAMRLLSPGGVLFTASCSFHVGRAAFLDAVAAAARESGRRFALEAVRGQAADHPEILTIPETAYLKGAVVRALD